MGSVWPSALGFCNRYQLGFYRFGFPLSATFDRRFDGVDVVVGDLTGLAVVARSRVLGILLLLVLSKLAVVLIFLNRFNLKKRTRFS